MNFEIRLAELNDCKDIAKIKLEVWKTTYKGIYPEEKFLNYDYDKEEEKFKTIVKSDDIDLYVATINNKIIGYMDCGKPMRAFKDYEQEIGLFYILEEYQRKGLGKRMFDIAYENIKSKGYKRFFISCNKYNYSAQKFYEKMGGVIVNIDEDMTNKATPQVKYHYDIK